MRFIFFIVALLVGGPVQAQVFAAVPLSPRPLSAFYGVSIPNVNSSSVSYPGCPGEVTTHTNTWYFDAAGQTQIGGGTGTVAHPWKDPQALTGNNAGTPFAGYTQILLATAPGGNGASPVKAGDLIVLNTGNYGALQLGTNTAIVNSPAITIVAGASQTPLFTVISAQEFTGLHIGDSTHQGVHVRSMNPGFVQGLITISDNGVLHSAGDTILENMDISSTDVATGDGLSKPTWITDMRPGIDFQTVNNIPSSTWSCASLVNSHVYEVSLNGLFGAVEGEVSSLLVQGNEIDHFYPIGVNFMGNNVAIGKNNFHDFIQTSQGSQQYAIFTFVDASLDHSKNQSNVYLYDNIGIENTDANLLATFQGAMSFYLNSTSDITNFVAWGNLMSGGGSCAICPGNVHNAIIASNSSMYSGTGQQPLMNFTQAHAGAGGFGTGPVGNAPSNVWAFNNIANQFAFAQGSVQGYYNIAAPATTGYANFVYRDGWNIQFFSPTPGSVVTVPAASGVQNLDDGGVGGADPQTNEFTSVPVAGSWPELPLPNFIPKVGSPAKSVGAIHLVPELPDYNGVTPNNSIGALN
jgi:hypothetical protein